MCTDPALGSTLSEAQPTSLPSLPCLTGPTKPGVELGWVTRELAAEF